MGACGYLQVCADDLTWELECSWAVQTEEYQECGSVAVRECTLTKRESRVEGVGQNHGIDLI